MPTDMDIFNCWKMRMSNRMDSYDVDFVVLWVDSSDPLWQKEKAQYTPNKSDDVQTVRYQDWENLKYWFRAVAKYAPWVRKIHLVTCGQVPEWLDIYNPKINLVKHSDYMPTDALPTFNSNAIDVGIHMIPGLAEHFVYFNDDMFITANIEKTYFFKNGIPVDMPGFIRGPKKIPNDVFSALLVNNSKIIQNYFSKTEILKRKTMHWFNPMYGKTFLRNVFFSCTPGFPGFVMPHLSVPYLKSDFRKVWSKESDILISTQCNRFRSEKDVSHFLIRNWRMCEGYYVPRKSKGKYYSIYGEKNAKRAANTIKKSICPEICINEVCTGEIFENAKRIINQAFAEMHNEKCEFEL